MKPREKSGSHALVPALSAAGTSPRQAVVGLEAEFTLLVDGREQRPETFFRYPAALLRHYDGRVVPRTGHSCHLPSGGALYFDTGVIEVATAPLELNHPGGCERAVRSLWEQIALVRQQLDAWEERSARVLSLRGFSAHYNFSILAPGAGVTYLPRLAHLLCCVLPVPMMLLAANRRSTAVGVRPRPGRIEVTADFTPDPALMHAALPFLAGVISETAKWPEDELTPAALISRGLPVLIGFKPSKHSSRKGWRAHANDFPRNPFRADPNACDWKLLDGRRVSLRQMACEVMNVFRGSIRRFAGRAPYIHLREVLEGSARSLLDFPDRPPTYDDVGRTIDWGRRRRTLPRSAYERVMRRIIAHEPLRIGRSNYLVERMPGWYEFVFRNVKTGVRRTFNLDELVRHVARQRD